MNVPKLRITLTVDGKLAKEIDKLYRKMLADALKVPDSKLPKLSNLYEDVLMEGWPIYKKKKKISD